MQTKGGGKHDILSVGRATATTRDCLWMMPRDPDADMCPGMETMPVSTQECMAHQSCICLRYQLVIDLTLAQCIACNRRFMYVQTMEECMARKRWNKRPIRRAGINSAPARSPLRLRRIWPA
jgi:hypothetical protein